MERAGTVIYFRTPWETDTSKPAGKEKLSIAIGAGDQVLSLALL